MVQAEDRRHKLGRPAQQTAGEVVAQVDTLLLVVQTAETAALGSSSSNILFYIMKLFQQG